MFFKMVMDEKVYGGGGGVRLGGEKDLKNFR